MIFIAVHLIGFYHGNGNDIIVDNWAAQIAVGTEPYLFPDSEMPPRFARQRYR
jgi:hypothetical protein